jgi:electron transfer flavoprotein alpha subunit
VNKSQGAEIFYYSDIGFVADIKEFVPVLVKKLAELKQREESVRNKQL